jgi:hypothetical protein
MREYKRHVNDNGRVPVQHYQLKRPGGKPDNLESVCTRLLGGGIRIARRLLAPTADSLVAGSPLLFLVIAFAFLLQRV